MPILSNQIELEGYGVRTLTRKQREILVRNACEPYEGNMSSTVYRKTHFNELVKVLDELELNWTCSGNFKRGITVTVI